MELAEAGGPDWAWDPPYHVDIDHPFFGLGLINERIVPALRAVMLYPVSALTTYGHANALLPDRWRMLGSLEALNGMLLFGLSTAFLFAVIQEVWALRGSGRRPKP
jgi:hypothetical protein